MTYNPADHTVTIEEQNLTIPFDHFVQLRISFRTSIAQKAQALRRELSNLNLTSTMLAE